LIVFITNQHTSLLAGVQSPLLAETLAL